ncbi:MAG: hypothetical protein PHQ35_10640 [Phycisphaerae bacterium]|nr:hypothetical protein [Phycisphaerae bacterium]
MGESDLKPTKEVNWINTEPRELRIFFFIGSRPANTNEAQIPDLMNPSAILKGFLVKMETKIIWSFAFELDEAAEIAKTKEPNFNLTFTNQKPTVREFLNEGRIDDYAKFIIGPVRDENEVVGKEKKEEQPVPFVTPRQLNFEQFRAGILFFANEPEVVLKREEDRKVLIKIIEGAEYAPKQ